MTARTHLTICICCLLLNVYLIFKYAPGQSCKSSDEEDEDKDCWGTLSKAIFGQSARTQNATRPHTASCSLRALRMPVRLCMRALSLAPLSRWGERQQSASSQDC